MLDAETVVWIPNTTSTDDYGDTTDTEGRRQSVLALFGARTNLENYGTDTAAVDLTKSLYILDPTKVPSSSDQYVIRGEVYDVVGDAHRWGSSGVEVIVKRTEARA